MPDNVVEFKIVVDPTTGEAQITKFSNDAVKSGKRVEDETEKQSKAIAKAWKTAFTVAATAVIAFGTAAINANLDFQRSMQPVNGMLSELTMRQEELAKNTLQVSDDFALVNDRVSEMTFSLVSGLGQVETTTRKMEIAGRALAAGFDKTGSSTSLLISVSKAYNDTSDEMFEKVSDLIFKTNELGQTSIPQLGAAFPQVAAKAAGLGVQIEEVAAGFATFAGVLGNTAEVGTQMRAVMNSFITQSKEMTAAIQDTGFANAEALLSTEGLSGSIALLIGQTDGSVEALGKLFGSSEAVAVAMALSGNQADSFAENLVKMENAAGSSQKAMDELAKSDAFKLDKELNRLTNEIIRLGESLAPVIGLFTDMFRGLNDLISGHDDSAAAAKRHYDEEISGVKSSTQEILGLAKRYDELRTSADLSKIEQRELVIASEALAEVVPELGGDIKDLTVEYGNLETAIKGVLSQKLAEKLFDLKSDVLIDFTTKLTDQVDKINEEFERVGKPELGITDEEVQSLISAAEQGGEAFTEAFQQIDKERLDFLNKTEEAFKNIKAIPGFTEKFSVPSDALTSVLDFGRGMVDLSGDVDLVNEATKRFDSVSKALGITLTKTKEVVEDVVDPPAGGDGGGDRIDAIASSLDDLAEQSAETQAQLTADFKAFDGDLDLVAKANQSRIEKDLALYALLEQEAPAYLIALSKFLPIVDTQMRESEATVEDLDDQMKAIAKSEREAAGGMEQFGLMAEKSVVVMEEAALAAKKLTKELDDMQLAADKLFNNLNSINDSLGMLGVEGTESMSVLLSSTQDFTDAWISFARGDYLSAVAQGLSGIATIVSSFFSGPTNEELMEQAGITAGQIFGTAWSDEAQTVMERVLKELPKAASGKVDIVAAMFSPQTQLEVIKGMGTLTDTMQNELVNTLENNVKPVLIDTLGMKENEAAQAMAPLFQEIINNIDGVVQPEMQRMINWAVEMGVELGNAFDGAGEKLSTIMAESVSEVFGFIDAVASATENRYDAVSEFLKTSTNKNAEEAVKSLQNVSNRLLADGKLGLAEWNEEAAKLSEKEQELLRALIEADVAKQANLETEGELLSAEEQSIANINTAIEAQDQWTESVERTVNAYDRIGFGEGFDSTRVTNTNREFAGGEFTTAAPQLAVQKAPVNITINATDANNIQNWLENGGAIVLSDAINNVNATQ